MVFDIFYAEKSHYPEKYYLAMDDGIFVGIDLARGEKWVQSPTKVRSYFYYSRIYSNGNPISYGLISGITGNREIIERLVINSDKYHKICLKCGGRLIGKKYFYKSKKDVQRVIEQLEPYCIMKKLCSN